MNFYRTPKCPKLKQQQGIEMSQSFGKLGVLNTFYGNIFQGAQIFEVVGLAKEVVDKCFVGSASRIGGSSFRVLAAESLARHNAAYSSRSCDNKLMPSPGYFHWRSGGEKHINDPLSVANLQVTTLIYRH